MTSPESTPLNDDQQERIVRQLAALAQPSRLNIFRELIKVLELASEGRGLSAGEIAVRMRVPPATLSFHLKELANAGLVSSRKQGRSVIYRAEVDSIRALITFLLEDCCSDCC